MRRHLSHVVTLLTNIANYGEKARASCAARQSSQKEDSARVGAVPVQGDGGSAHELGHSLKLPAIIASRTPIPLRLEMLAEQVTSSEAGHIKV